MKKCDLGHFQDLGHSFSLYGPPRRQITYIAHFETEGREALASATELRGHLINLKDPNIE